MGPDGEGTLEPFLEAAGSWAGAQAEGCRAPVWLSSGSVIWMQRKGRVFRGIQNYHLTFSVVFPIIISNSKHWKLDPSACLPWGSNPQYEKYGIQA